MIIKITGISQKGRKEETTYTRTRTSVKAIKNYLDGYSVDEVELSILFQNNNDFKQLIAENADFKYMLRVTEQCMWRPYLDKLRYSEANRTEVKQSVKDIADEIYKFGLAQVLIDLVQDYVEELLNSDPSRDDIGALSYQCGLLLDIYNTAMVKDIDFLNRLKKALDNWEHSIEFVNKSLGLPPEA